MLIIDFLRHGELEGGVKYRGALDEALTPEGRASMGQVWSQISLDITHLFSSPLSRCAEPALAWAAERGLSCKLDQRLQELSYGDWEGLTPLEIEETFPGMLEAWREDPTDMTPPNGESMLAFSKRVFAFMDEVLLKYQDGHILIVAHSGTIRLMLAYILEAPLKSTRHMTMPYACWSRAHVEHGRLSLVFHHRDPLPRPL